MRMRAVLLGTVLAAAPLQAQRASGEVLVMPLEHRVLYQGAELKHTGTWIGARAELAHRALRVEALALAGTLGGSADSANPDQDARTTLISARLAVRPWLEAGVAAEARRFSSSTSTSTWRAYGVTARASTDLGLPLLHGFAELTVYPLASGTAVVAPTSGTRGAVGLRIAPPASLFALHLAYRFERFNVDDPASVPRTEQFEGILIGAGIRLGR